MVEKLDIKPVKHKQTIKAHSVKSYEKLGPNEVNLKPECLYWFSCLSPSLLLSLRSNIYKYFFSFFKFLFIERRERE